MSIPSASDRDGFLRHTLLSLVFFGDPYRIKELSEEILQEVMSQYTSTFSCPMNPNLCNKVINLHKQLRPVHLIVMGKPAMKMSSYVTRYIDSLALQGQPIGLALNESQDKMNLAVPGLGPPFSSHNRKLRGRCVKSIEDEEEVEVEVTGRSGRGNGRGGEGSGPKRQDAPADELEYDAPTHSRKRIKIVPALRTNESIKAAAMKAIEKKQAGNPDSLLAAQARMESEEFLIFSDFTAKDITGAQDEVSPETSTAVLLARKASYLNKEPTGAFNEQKRVAVIGEGGRSLAVFLSECEAAFLMKSDVRNISAACVKKGHVDGWAYRFAPEEDILRPPLADLVETRAAAALLEGLQGEWARVGLRSIGKRNPTRVSVVSYTGVVLATYNSCKSASRSGWAGCSKTIERWCSGVTPYDKGVTFRFALEVEGINELTQSEVLVSLAMK